MRSEIVLLRWKKPSRVERAEYDATLKWLWPICVRIAASSAVVCAVFYFTIEKLFPDLRFPWTKIFPSIAAMLGICCVFILLARFFRTSYELTDCRIRDGHEGIFFKDVEKSYAQAHSLVPDARVVRFLLKNGRIKFVSLPNDEMAAEILREIELRVPFTDGGEFPAPERKFFFSEKDLAFLFSFTLACVAIVGITAYVYPEVAAALFLRIKAWLELVILLNSCVGFGTLGCLILYRQRLFRERESLRTAFFVAFPFNFLGFALGLLVFLIALALRGV